MMMMNDTNPSMKLGRCWRFVLGVSLILWVTTTTTSALVLSSANQRTIMTRTSMPKILSTQQCNARVRPQRICQQQISMHMGHSHSHHTHNHEQQSSIAKPTSESNNNSSSSRIRRYALIMFCAVVTLGRPIVFSKTAITSSSTSIMGLATNILRTIRLSDYMAFLISAITCRFFIEPIRQEIKHAVSRLRMIGDGFVKHAPPPSSFFSMTRILLSPSSDEWNTYTTNDKSSVALSMDHKNIAADRVTILGGFMNIVLSAAKLFVGITCHSSALIADAGHSLSDLFSDFITLWAVQVGRLPPDDDHPYGHGKFEAIGALFLALTLLGTGISVGIMSNSKLLEIISIQRSATAVTIPQLPTFPALFMAGISIVSKEWLFRITRNVGERINSQVVIANAWHHRSDAYSSVLALFSIGLAMAGLVAADAAAGLLVAGMICMTGAEILGESVKQLTDTTDEQLVRKVTDIAANTKDVELVKRVRARHVGSSSVIDIYVCIPENMSSVSEARTVEERLRTRILQEDGVLDVDVKVICPNADISSSLQPGQQSTTANGDRNEVTIAPIIISKAEVEANVRDEILTQYPEIHSVHSITVHYQDIVTNPIDVDVAISLHDIQGTTIASAAQLAENVRSTLEQSSQIHKANIFLDLNQMNYQYQPSNDSQA